MINLERIKEPRLGSNLTVHLLRSKPFVENSRGVLIHRPRSARLRFCRVRNKPYLSVHFYCGMVITGFRKITFLDFPDESKVLCARCEEIALKFRLPPADAVAGRHVHKGGVKAARNCCKTI